MTIMGLLAFLRYKKFPGDRSRIMKSMSSVIQPLRPEIAISRISIRFGGIVFAALGIALLINTLLNMEYGV
jgi:hypothetical protein